jgi:hypothetical protein
MGFSMFPLLWLGLAQSCSTAKGSGRSSNQTMFVFRLFDGCTAPRALRFGEVRRGQGQHHHLFTILPLDRDRLVADSGSHAARRGGGRETQIPNPALEQPLVVPSRCRIGGRYAKENTVAFERAKQ